VIELSSQYLLLYGAVLGFALAGFAACSFEYATGTRLQFDMGPNVGAFIGALGFLVRMIAGPYLVARFLVGLSSEEPPHPLLVGAGGALVIAWSLSLGILIITSLMR